MLEFADQLKAELSGGSEDYRTSTHRHTTIANRSVEDAWSPEEVGKARGERGPGGGGGGGNAETRKRFDALLYTAEEEAMRRLLHHDLMRGQKAQRVAIILLAGLVLVLIAALFHGVRLLEA